MSEIDEFAPVGSYARKKVEIMRLVKGIGTVSRLGPPQYKVNDFDRENIKKLFNPETAIEVEKYMESQLELDCIADELQIMLEIRNG